MANVDYKKLEDVANVLRIHSIEATQASKSGHPTSCASLAEIMSVLFFKTMRYSLTEPRNGGNDRFVLSKGHAAPILYAAWAEAGLFPASDLLNLRKIDSDLEGHPTPRLNFVDVATGSLGQGINCAAGMAWVGKNVDKLPYRVYCVLGDGESAEGSVWEALSYASIYKLDNLVAIFDINRLGQSEPTAFQHHMEIYEARLKAFGWETFVVDGHDVQALDEAFEAAKKVQGKPQAILCKTFKGQGFPGIADKDNWHGKPLGDKAAQVVTSLKAKLSSPAHGLKPQPSPPQVEAPKLIVSLGGPVKYAENFSTRQAYGVALAKLGRSCDRIVAFDGDTKNSTFADTFRKEFPERFSECYIAEQNMVGVGIGASCRDRTIAFVSTFASFFSRTYDHIRMAAISQSNVNFVGSHCGVSIGEDGPSQMALEDLAMFRAIPGCTVFYPSDAVSTEHAICLAAQTKGITYTRTSRPATKILHNDTTQFAVGKAVVLRQGADVVFIGGGVTVHETVSAAEQLSRQHKIEATVIDPFTIKPLDVDCIVSAAKAAGMRVVVVEDHYPEGGIGEAVLSVLNKVQGSKALAFEHLCVREVPRSGPPAVLLGKYGIDAKAIVEAAKRLVK